jgi:hypothetical protein
LKDGKLNLKLKFKPQMEKISCRNGNEAAEPMQKEVS